MFCIYKEYAKELNETYSANLSSAITLSHMSYMIWSNMFRQDFPNITIYKLPMEMYKKMVSCYYGGRVMLNQAKFESKEFEKVIEEAMENEGWVSHATFEEIEDFLMKLDVVSLYPSVMTRSYPCGKYQYYENIKQEDEERYINLIHSLHSSNWASRVFMCVDVKCPKDLIIPFLMSRDSKTKQLEQNLFDKVEQTYYGPEIQHACLRLGYRVTKVHWVMEFAQLERIFLTFINKFWEIKKSATKGTVKYETAKGTGNSLSGKFGQIEHMINTLVRLIQTEKDTEFDCVSFEFIYDTLGEIVGVITQEEAQKDTTTYSSYLSFAILALSRVKMSEDYMIPMQSYKLKENAPFYGDTDSFIVPKHAANLIPASKMGKELGQLDDEFSGGKAISFSGPALKTYNQIYVSGRQENGRHEVLSITRCKGIPHTADSRNVFALHHKKKQFEVSTKDLETFMLSTKAKMAVKIPIGALGLRGVLYRLQSEANKEDYLFEFIGKEEMDRMLQRSTTITAYFRSIRKVMRPHGDTQGISVYTGLMVRKFCASDWWRTNTRRIFSDSFNIMTMPVGSESLEEETFILEENYDAVDELLYNCNFI